MEKKPFAELGLSPELLKAVARLGYEEASPIQSAAIPVLLAGRDVIGQSQTGSGKTAAFAIPVIEQVQPEHRAPQALILCPTRELAVQVAEEVAKLAMFKRGVRELPIYGGQSYDRQLRGLRDGAQIIVGTPGRVMDHLQRRTLSLDAVKTFVLDEADRMLDMGFREDIETILAQAPAERQIVLFSATVPAGIKAIINRFTRDPVTLRIEAHKQTTPDIEQVYYEVERRSKLEALCRLIDVEDIQLGIVFCATKLMTDELAGQLVARGYRAEPLHGDMSQAARERVMGRFRQRQCEFLVATDVAARGLDVDDIEVVFNYDLPNDGDDYVHRIGRTGRAGRKGKAVTFVSSREAHRLQYLTRATGVRIHRARLPSLDEVEERRTEALFEHLRETLTEGKYRKQDEALDRLFEAGHTPTDVASALIHLLTPAAAGEQKKSAPTTSAPERPKVEFDGPPRPERSERPERDFERPAPRREMANREPEAVSPEAGMVRLVFNLGEKHEARPGDFVGVVAGVTRLGKEVVGAIHIMQRQSLVDIAEQHVDEVLKKLNGIRFKGRKLMVELPAAGGPVKKRKGQA